MAHGPVQKCKHEIICVQSWNLSYSKSKSIMLMEEIRNTTWDVQNNVYHGINYQLQLVSQISSINSMSSRLSWTNSSINTSRQSFPTSCLVTHQGPNDLEQRDLHRASDVHRWHHSVLLESWSLLVSYCSCPLVGSWKKNMAQFLHVGWRMDPFLHLSSSPTHSTNLQQLLSAFWRISWRVYHCWSCSSLPVAWRMVKWIVPYDMGVSKNRGGPPKWMV